MGRNDLIILELGHGTALFLITVTCSTLKLCGRAPGRVHACDCPLTPGVMSSRTVIPFWSSRRLSPLNHIILIRWVVHIFKVLWGTTPYTASIRVCWHVPPRHWGGIVGDRTGTGGNLWHGGHGAPGPHLAVQAVDLSILLRCGGVSRWMLRHVHFAGRGRVFGWGRKELGPIDHGLFRLGNLFQGLLSFLQQKTVFICGMASTITGRTLHGISMIHWHSLKTKVQKTLTEQHHIDNT